MQNTAKVELLKLTKPKNCIFVPFVDKNSHRTTKPHNFDIKCQCNSDTHGFFWTKFGGVRIFYLRQEVFPMRESNLLMTGRTLFYQSAWTRKQ